MSRSRRWVMAISLVLAVIAVLLLAAVHFIPDDKQLAERASAELEKSLGVPTKVGAVHWRLLPTVAVVIANVVTDQPQPIVIKELTVYPDVTALLHRKIKIDRAELDGARVPQLSLRGLGQGKDKDAPKDTKLSADSVPLAHFVFHDVTWISRLGVPVVYDGEAVFDPNWRPSHVLLTRPGAATPFEFVLTREGNEDRWAVRIKVGGGTANGEARLKVNAKEELQLEGQLHPRGVEVKSALETFNRHSVVSGRASGDTTFSAHGPTVGGLTTSLHTTTPFTMAPATILRFDLDKAIHTLGKDHTGQTVLKDISGQFDTQNSPDGMVVDYTNLKAHSGSLTASGNVRVANRQVDGDLAVDLVDGVVGVPLHVTGPFSAIKVSVPGGAVAGAVIGTAVLPGVGTVIGARIGAALGNIFGKPKPVVGGAAAPPPPKAGAKLPASAATARPASSASLGR